ncbi:hypothetical protein GCM10009780_81300 [Actinomadura alba]
MTTEGAIVPALVLFFGFLAGMVTALIVVVCGIVLGVRHSRRSPVKRLGAASLLAGKASTCPVPVRSAGAFQSTVLVVSVLHAEQRVVMFPQVLHE